MNTNSLNYEHCLRPTDTKFIVHKLSRNQHLNIVGTNPIHGTTRLLKDVKALETQLPAVVIVYVNLREYKRSFDLFLQEVATQIDVLEAIADFKDLSIHLRKKALTHQIWLLLAELDIAFEENHEAFSYKFLEQLNSFKNAPNISLLCTTSQALKVCSIITPDEDYGTSPLILNSTALKPIYSDNITEELNRHNIKEADFAQAIKNYKEPHGFMEHLIKANKEQLPHQKKWMLRKKIEVWKNSYEKSKKRTISQWWRNLKNHIDKFIIKLGIKNWIKDWVKAFLGKD